jgi:hypothetical protein
LLNLSSYKNHHCLMSLHHPLQHIADLQASSGF